MKENLIIDQTYEYVVEDIIPFTKEALNKVSDQFNIDVMSSNNFYWVEFEAFLLNGINGELSTLIYLTFLHPSQLKFLGEELFRSLRRQGLDKFENNADKFVFRFKFRDYFNEY